MINRLLPLGSDECYMAMNRCLSCGEEFPGYVCNYCPICGVKFAGFAKTSTRKQEARLAMKDHAMRACLMDPYITIQVRYDYERSWRDYGHFELSERKDILLRYYYAVDEESQNVKKWESCRIRLALKRPNVQPQLPDEIVKTFKQTDIVVK